MKYSAWLVIGWCAGAAGCTPAYQQAKGRPFEDVTLQNLMQWPSDRDYLEAKGSGRPPDGEKNADARRRVSRDSAILDAERQLIPQLEKLVPREKVRTVLRQARVGTMEYTYDDGCNLTLRIPKDLVTGKSPIE